MFSSRTMLVFILATLLAGCSYVVSKHPVGLEKYPLNPEQWDGRWLHEEGVIAIKVTDPAKGTIQLAWIEHDQEELRFEVITCQILKGKNWLYINELEFPEEEDDGYFFWGRLKKEERRILFWSPSVEAFAAAAESKKIRALVNKNESGSRIEDVRLQDEPEKIIELIENSGSEFLEWEAPITLLRLGG